VTEIDRVRGIRRTLFWVLGANVAVAAGKAVYGYLSGSVAISTDAVHSLLDASTNVIGLVGLHFASAPADEGHPYGHRKFEILASAGIGVGILSGGFQFAKAAVSALLGGSAPPTIGPGGFLLVLATLCTSGLIARAERRAGERLASPFLLADAQHTASDVIASGVVLLAFIGARAGLAYADPVGALVVLCFIAQIGWRVLKQNLSVLVDAAVVDPQRVIDLARAVSGVDSIHRIRSRGIPGAAHLDLHLQVDPTITVRAAHEIAHEVENRLRAGLAEVADVTIHVEPAGDPEEGY
jgi:cation diffusion facilitator family transporter